MYVLYMASIAKDGAKIVINIQKTPKKCLFKKAKHFITKFNIS